MKIIIDIYGGDNAPLAPLKGAEMAVKELGVEIIAVGNEAEMKEICEKENISTEGFTFVDAPLVMPVCAEPTSALKEYKESSLVKGLAKNIMEEAFPYLNIEKSEVVEEPVTETE